jgi:hypothetical protein
MLLPKGIEIRAQGQLDLGEKERRRMDTTSNRATQHNEAREGGSITEGLN